MRNKDMLKSIQDTAKLMQWLYADPNNSITVKNCIEAELKLSMDDEGCITCENLSSPGSKPFGYDNMLSLPIWLGIIEQLEAQPPVNPRVQAKSRWEEIQMEAAVIRTMNKI